MVNNVMKRSIRNKPCKQARFKDRNKRQSQAICKDVPRDQKERGNYKPGHGDENFGGLVMYLVTLMSKRSSFMVEPSMARVFNQAPT